MNAAKEIRTAYPAPIAYTYMADVHCPQCAGRAFGVDEHGTIPETARDGEGNPIGAVAPWDEVSDTEESSALHCGTCGREIVEGDAF
jgi:hypothetical protein